MTVTGRVDQQVAIDASDVKRGRQTHTNAAGPSFAATMRLREPSSG
jgi:hypothetical protein